MRKWIIRLLVVSVIGTALSWLWPYVQSKNGQVQRRQDQIIRLASKRNWDAVTAMIATEYEDQWSMNREDSVNLAHEMLQAFLSLEITWKTDEITVSDNMAKVRGHARINGSGVGFSQTVKDMVNALEEPWVFTWRTDGWKPDDWKLLSLRNKGLGGPLPVDAIKKPSE